MKAHENPLLTNKSAAAQLRDAEREIVARGEGPVPIRCTPVHQWDEYLERDVTVPAEVARLCAIPHALPMDERDVHGMEEAVEEFHHVRHPYHITMSPIMQQHGRPWRYVSESAPFLTGFSLVKVE